VCFCICSGRLALLSVDDNCTVFFMLFSADFFQLLFVCLQWKVFSVENYEESDAEGGCNRSVIPSIQKENPDPNPREDFITYKEYVIVIHTFLISENDMYYVTTEYLEKLLNPRGSRVMTLPGEQIYH